MFKEPREGGREGGRRLGVSLTFQELKFIAQLGSSEVQFSSWKRGSDVMSLWTYVCVPVCIITSDHLCISCWCSSHVGLQFSHSCLFIYVVHKMKNICTLQPQHFASIFESVQNMHEAMCYSFCHIYSSKTIQKRNVESFHKLICAFVRCSCKNVKEPPGPNRTPL